jgi:hypothetical protein
LSRLASRLENRTLGRVQLRFLGSLNKPDDFILVIVEFTSADTHNAHYLRQPFNREHDFGVTSVNYGFAKLLARATAPL